MDYANRAAGTLHIRAIRPEDQPALRRWFSTVSAESRYARFLGFVTDLSPQQWSYLTTVDGRDHVAFLAWYDGQLAGVARWVRFADEPDTAEIAFLIGDEHQRRGIGVRLCERLVEAARDNGVRRFRAYVLPYNRGIRRLLAGPAFEDLRDTGNELEVGIRDTRPIDPERAAALDD